MNLKEFSLLGEDDNNYKIGHPSGKSITVPKKGLVDKAHELIKGLKPQKMFSGGKVGAFGGHGIDDPNYPVFSKTSQTGIKTPYSNEFGDVESQDISEGLRVGHDVRKNKPQQQNSDSQNMSDGGEAQSSNIQDSPEQIASDAGPEQSVPQGIPASAEATPQAQTEEAPAAATPDQPGINPTNVNPAIGQAIESIQGGVKAEGDIGKAEQQSMTQAANQIQAMPIDQIFAKHQAKDAALEQAYAIGKIDPNRYIKNMDTGSKITSGIAMILGGIGSGLTGGPNLAAQHIQNAINADIEAQKNDQSKSMNLWKMNREQTQSDVAATLATQNQFLTAAKVKLAAATGGAQGAMAAARAAPELLNLNEQITSNNRLMSLLDFEKQGGLAKTDPSQLVPYLVKNPDQQKQVYEEIGRAQNVSRNSQNILSEFDNAAKENTVMKTGAGLLRTPGSVMALHQLLLPNFKQIDGTVRQAAMDETFHNVTPQPGDSAEKIAYKKQALQDWMHSELSAPVAKGAGLDLQRFESTKANMSPVTKTMNGISYKQVPGGWQKVQ